MGVMVNDCVQTKCGEIRGEPYAYGMRFLGIPYAKAPVGRLRFMPPQAIDRYVGVFNAVTMPKNPPQGSFDPKTQSEDCLKLNIWTPNTDDASPKAVMFWIYGGSFSSGGISESFYDMSVMARDTGCILITANYRLNVCGFLDLRDALPYATANNGLRDIVLALEWVHDNIAYFGGDPENVTVFGQSAGAVLAQALLAVPCAEHLFHKLIAQSPCGDTYYSPNQAKNFRNMWLQMMHFPSKDELASMPIKRLLSKNSELSKKKTLQQGFDCVFNPVIDGEFLVCHPSEIPTETITKKMMMGLTRDETEPIMLLMKGLVTKTETVQNIIMPDYEEELKKRVTADLKCPSHKALKALLSERMYRYPATVFADRYAKNADLYFYRYDYMPRVIKALHAGVLHATEIPILFDSGIKIGSSEIKISNANTAREVGARMRKWWGNFAKSGCPSATWEKYQPETRAMRIIDATDQTIFDPFGKRMALYYDYISTWKK